MGARWCTPTPTVLCVCSPSKASSEPSTAACLHATVSAHCAKGTDQTHTSEAVFIELLVVLHIARLKDILAVLPYSASQQRSSCFPLCPPGSPRFTGLGEPTFSRFASPFPSLVFLLSVALRLLSWFSSAWQDCLTGFP